MTLCPNKFLASEPKEPRRYFGASFKGRKCKKHRIVLVLEDEGHSCECCGDFPPEYRCSKCEDAYNISHNKWFRKWGHMVAVGERLMVKNGKLLTMNNVYLSQFFHGGKPIKRGKWCKLGEDGFIKLSKKPWNPNMLVIS